MSIVIKKIKKKQTIRKRKCSSSSDEDSIENLKSIGEIIEQTQDAQKNRLKQSGVSSESLYTGKIFKKNVEQVEKEGYNLATGGCVDAKTLKKEMINDELKSIGTSFAAETNQRDEDTEMLKFVEKRMAEKRGYSKQKSEEVKTVNREDQLYELPERLKLLTSKSKKSEDMLSHAMLSGIPEIQLGISQKIKNIEATEDAKMRMIKLSQEQQDNSMQKYVPTNMAVNFMQHNRFKVDETVPTLNEAGQEGDRRLPGRGAAAKDNKSEKCTDDFHFDKFRNKTLRR